MPASPVYIPDSLGNIWQLTADNNGRPVTTLVSTGSGGSILGSSIIKNALWEIQALDFDGTPSDAEYAFALSKMNDIIDQWAARSIMAWNLNFAVYTLVPNLSPHTIGPTGTFVVTQRPVTVESASVVLTNSQPWVDVPMNIRDDAWWAANDVKSLTSTIPTDLYYSPDWENGSLYFWPVPTTAYGVRLETWNVLSQLVTVDQPISVPPAYRDALTMSLAVRLAPAYGKGASLSPVTIEAARRALVALQGNNSKSPRITTAEAGQGNRTRGSMFNWETGQIV